MSLAWRQEGYGHGYVKPPTWVLGGPPLGRAIYAKVIMCAKQWFWFASDQENYVGPYDTNGDAQSAAQRHVEAEHPPPLN